MEAAIVIAFREGLEAFLVLGLILAFLEKIDAGQYKKNAWAGFFTGIVAAVVLAIVFTVMVDGFESEELQYTISLAVLFSAIVLLTYMVFWMQRSSELATMQQKIELSSNQRLITFVIVFLAVFREGLETALFTLALIVGGESSAADIVMGLCVGLLVSAVLIWGLFKWSVRIPLKKFFQYSSYFILLIVAGLVSLFIKGLQGAEYLPTIMSPLYDSGFLLENDSALGSLLGILMGYDATPSLLQFVAWGGYLVLIFIVIWGRKK